MSKQKVVDPFATKRPRLIPLLITLVVLLFLAVWGFTAMVVEDALWFLPGVGSESLPTAIDLYWDGAQTHLVPGMPEFDLVVAALDAEVPQIQSWGRGATLSDATLTELRQNGRLLEIHYDAPVRIRSQFRFSASPVYYIPLSGFNFGERRIFNQARVGPLELQSVEQIYSASARVAQQRAQ